MKNSYVLLRNNIESSSLELEDLKQIGIQPTDLIWVECQSVCWQRPSEIAELKNHITKNTNQTKATPPQELSASDIGKVEVNTSIKSEKKLVHIELPFKSNADEKKELLQANNDAVLINMNKYGNPNHSTASKPSSDLLFDELDKNHIPSPYKNEKLEKTIFGIELPANIKRIAFYSCLIAAGAIIMLLIMTNDKKTKVVLQPAPYPTEQVVAASNQPEVNEADTASSVTENFSDNAYQPPKELEISKEINNAKKETVNIKTPGKVIENSKETAQIKPAIKQIPTEPVSELKESKKIPVENIYDQLALKANDYNMGSFGGIKNLKMTLQNNSSYIIDKATVTINYLNPEGNTVNSEKINFQSISPGASSTIEVKKSKRGVKIDFQISKVESKELALNN